MATVRAPARPVSRQLPAARSLLAGHGAIVAITLAAAVLRFATLDLQSLWFDESVTVIDILDPGLWDTMRAVVFEDITPPLYFLLAWLWTQPFGDGEIGLRSLSAVFGTATVPVAYLLGARLASRRAGLIAASLVAASPLMLWFSQEGRAYSLAIFLVALSLLLWIRALQDRTRRAVVAWACVSALALLSHYFAAFPVALECVWLLVVTRARRDVLAAGAGFAALVAAMVPMIAEQTADGDADWVARFESLSARLGELPERFLIGPPEALGGGSSLPWVALLVAAIAALCVRAGRSTLRSAAPVAVVGIGTIGVPALLAAAGLDYFLYRYVVVAWVPLAVAAAVVMASRRLGRAGPAAAVAATMLLLAVSLVSVLDRDLHRENWRTMSTLVGPPTTDRAVAIGDWFERQPLMAYGHTFYAMPREGWRVKELVVVGKPHLWERGWNAKPRLDAPPPGFRLVERRTIVTGLTLLRFRSDSPRHITHRGLWATNRIPAEAIVLEGPPR